MASTGASGFVTEEPPDEADGVVTAWIRYETGVGRGRGLLRLVEEDGEDRAFTLLTTLYELKGFEEPRGTHRPMGAEHGASKHRTTWKERQQQEAESLGSTTQPYVLVIGGGQGGIALGARASGSSAYRAWSSTRTRVPATSGAAATSPCACTTRSGTTTCPT